MQDFISLFEYTFFRNALYACMLTSIIAGITGTYIVARKTVFISGGITHASFGGIGIAYFLGFNPFIGATIFAVSSAISIEWVTQKAKIREDSAIAILWSLGMALGIIFVFLTPGYTPNLMSFLFGNILTVSQLDIITMLILAIVIVASIILFYHPVLFTAYDPEYAITTGIPVKIIKYLVAIAIALTIVVSIRIAGIILVLSLFTIPQAIAGSYTKDFKKIIYLSIIHGLIGTTAGLIGSYFLDLPSGAIIIFTLIVIWLFTRLIKFLIIYGKKS